MITENDKRLGKRIKRLRKAKGLTQEQLAEKAGISMKYVQFIENAHRIPALKTLYKIARVLGVKVEEIFPF
ncbi:MAG TPA: helix-turn-helix transcriptional regulator [Clostridia bacterium]